MGSSGDGFGNRIPVALAALIALVFMAGVAAVAGWLTFVLKVPAEGSALLAAAHPAPPACRICGVVEQVREIDRPPAAGPLTGSQSESIVLLIAALGGGPERLVGLPRTYETEVRLEDGSVRVLRDARVPLWKRGDHVKVIRGRVEPARDDAF